MGLKERVGWITALNPSERATCAACFGARGLDAMDAQIYALVLPSILLTFHLTRAQVGVLGTSMGLGAAITTTFAGMAADRFGRLRVMQTALLIASLATVLLAFAGTFREFVVLRGIQGMAYGAELVTSMTLVTEAVRGPWRARASAAVQSGHAVGYMTALIAVMALHASGYGDHGWRALFALGVAPAVLALSLHRLIPESRAYLAMRAQRETRPALTALVAPHFLRSTVLTVLVGVGVFGAAQVMMIWMPIFLQTELHKDMAYSAAYLAINIAGAGVGPWIYGPLSDRWGRKTVFILFLMLQSATILTFITVVDRGMTMGLAPFIFILGLFQGGLGIAIQPIIAELYPTALRARAMGLNTSFIKGTAALPPALVGVMAMTVPLGWAMSVVVMAFYGLALVCLLFLPETRPVLAARVSVEAA